MIVFLADPNKQIRLSHNGSPLCVTMGVNDLKKSKTFFKTRLNGWKVQAVTITDEELFLLTLEGKVRDDIVYE